MRWLAADNGKNLDEAGGIVAREMRYSKSVALFTLKDKSETSWEFGETGPERLINALKSYRSYQVSVKAPSIRRRS